MHNLSTFEKCVISFGLTVLVMFGIWTVCYHIITFGGLTWHQVVRFKWLIASLIALLSLWLALQWLSSATIATEPAGGGDPKFLINNVPNHWSIAWILLAFAIVAIVLLGYHRSDFDDGEYLQLVFQTIRNPQLVPHTFDASLGELRQPLRFAPYRAASYETFIAFFSELTSSSVFATYYQIVPLLTGLASCAVAYAFLRWLHPQPAAAIGLLLFVVICIAWGETHVAYGNRMFVRLFQGKGLLVTLTTPMTLLAGLAVLRKPIAIHAMMLFLSVAAAVGASSSGLVVSLITLSMIGLMGLLTCRLAAWPRLIGILLLAGIYPVGLSTWLKLSASKSGVTEAIGTVLPIQASLGSTVRMALVVLIFGIAAAVLIRRNTELHSKRTPIFTTIKQVLKTRYSQAAWLLLVFACIMLPLNPIVAEFFAHVGARNMSWRLAWAAPVPLLLASGLLFISTELNLQARIDAKSRKFSIGQVVCGTLVCLFLISGGWTIRASNNGEWDWPGAKLPPEALQADQLGKKIKQEMGYKPSDGRVLLDPRLAVWLPVSHPDIRLIMPGHGYPITFSTTMPRQEYEERMELNKIWNQEEGGHWFYRNALAQKYGVIASIK